MPNAKVLSEKQAIVAELTEKIQKATAGVIVDYKGITVEEDTALRKECREGGMDYAVVKNTLLRFAFNNTGLNDLTQFLQAEMRRPASRLPVQFYVIRTTFGIFFQNAVRHNISAHGTSTQIHE